MALMDDVIARIPAQTLKELTRNRNNSATTSDTTLLAIVCTDVQAELEVELGVNYQDASLPARDIAFHTVKGVEGVLIKLEIYTAVDASSATRRYERWQSSLERRRKRGVVQPGSNAKGTVRDDRTEDHLIFDRQDQQKSWLPSSHGENRVGENDPIRDE